MQEQAEGQRGAPAARRTVAAGTALRFVVLLGVVSLLADVTYEGARSVTGPYLAVLGASGLAVGVIAGAGELVGYGLRLAAGYLSDRTRRYWGFTLLGYAVNLLAVPLLALAGRWEVAGGLIVAERVGKAVRTPPRDAMLSHATAELGRGWGFGLHEAMDQIGAVTGPLLVAAVLATGAGYRAGFATLLVPALLALAVVVAARFTYRNPEQFEPQSPDLEAAGLPRAYWLYLAAVGLVAAGFADFALVAFHFQRQDTVPAAWIPAFYAVAMGVDAAAALVFGRLFDRHGLPVLAAATALSAAFAPLAFLGGSGLALAGVALWGVGLGAHESVMRAAVAGLAPADRRASAYGLFNAGYGLAWFAGSAALGLLYDVSIPALVGVSVALQVAALPLLLRLRPPH